MLDLVLLVLFVDLLISLLIETVFLHLYDDEYIRFHYEKSLNAYILKNYFIFRLLKSSTSPIDFSDFY